MSGIQSFTISTSSAKLVLKSPLDYEHTTSFLLTLTITDTGKPAQPSGNITIKVKVKRFSFFFHIFHVILVGTHPQVNIAWRYLGWFSLTYDIPLFPSGVYFRLQRPLPSFTKCWLWPQAHSPTPKGGILCCCGNWWGQWNKWKDNIQEESCTGSPVSSMSHPGINKPTIQS